MNITTDELKSLRAILSKEDKHFIAEQAKKSYRTIEAILGGDRHCDSTEHIIITRAENKIASLTQTLERIKLKN